MAQLFEFPGRWWLGFFHAELAGSGDRIRIKLVAMPIATTISETDILADVLGADEGDLSPAVARAVMKWKFSSQTSRRITQLAQKNQRGSITARERETLERYLRVGSFINLLQAKARLSLKSSVRAGK